MRPLRPFLAELDLTVASISGFTQPNLLIKTRDTRVLSHFLVKEGFGT